MAENNTNHASGSKKGKMNIKSVTERAKIELKDLTGFDASSVTSIKKEGDTWKVMVELLEKIGIPDRMDILGIYEARIDNTGDLVGYERKGLRKRGDTTGQEPEESVE
jgi:alcohol dehydrogenase class IV